MTNVEVSFLNLKYKWDTMSDVEKEPYVIAGKNQVKSDTTPDPVQDPGLVKITENTAKQDMQEEDVRIEKEMKKVDAISRSIFMEEEKRFDYSKRKATEMKQNTKVYLPGALGIDEESSLELLRREWLE